MAEDERPDVCIVMHDLRGGGAERVTLRLAQGMAQAGRKVELVLLQPRNDYGDLPSGVASACLHLRRVALAAPRLAAHLKQRAPRAVVSVMTHVNLTTIAAMSLARLQAPLMVVEHNQMSQKVAAARGLTTRLTYALVPWAYRKADIVGAVSRGVADDLARMARLPPDQVQVFYNPVVDDDLRRRAEAPCDHPWTQPGEPPVILGVGRLHPQKDFPTLIRAFAALRGQGSPARLIILGEGEERGALEVLAGELGVHDAIDLPGFTANPYAFMSRAAVFTLSSRWEGLPTVLIEALACGAQVVSTDCPSGPREILEEGRWGRLVPVGDSLALAGALGETLRVAPTECPSTGIDAFTVERASASYLHAIGLQSAA